VPTYPPHDAIEQFSAWVYEPGPLMGRPRGYWTADMWIRPHALLVRARRIRVFGRLLHFDEIGYGWPTVVVEHFKPFRIPVVLIEIDGELGGVHVRNRARLRSGLERAGFKVIERLVWGYEAPRPVPRDALGDHVNDVPGCVVAR
jgi:hypothetical protein